ncbi:MAG: EscN/YscN/HrcN family type III secretion system ATPase [Halobacteriovoraceae bacterium]|nr:EscN/YscN/HrcN family type III secretion system ATPase [Halobacteriovoraceae bacterium]
MNKDFFIDIPSIYKQFENKSPFQKIGKVNSSLGGSYEVSLSKAILGSNVEFVTDFGKSCFGEVIAIKGNKCIAMPYEELTGINSETKVYLRDLTTEIKLSDSMLGRVLDYKCEPLDQLGELEGPFELRSIFGKAINPLDRKQIRRPLDLGINSINGFLTVGKGQRISILAGSGVGKSVLLGMISRNTRADVNVIALIGERGREVLEFIENDLGKEGLEKSIIISATSDTSPLIRMKSAYVATTIAEYFRDKGQDVLLMMDSITRFAMAGREIALSAGEFPGQKGYSPSIFAKLPKLMERVGTKKNSGTITGIYTVLVEGGDMDEPISDSIRAISDGHIVLSRDLANKNHFPAIDILSSLSRVMNKVVTKEHRIVASDLRDLLSSYIENEDLINVGAYVKGSNPRIDKAIEVYDDLMNLVRQNQDSSEVLMIDQMLERMIHVVQKAQSFEEG